MTVIEFFDRTPMENVVCTLASKPEKVVFIGDRKRLDGFRPIFERILDQHGFSTQAEFRSLPSHSLEDIVFVLESVVLQQQECLLDVTGGEDVLLVAAGIVYERHRSTCQIRVERYDVARGTASDCDGDGLLHNSVRPTLSVEEVISLHGGTVRRDTGRECDTRDWDFSEEFLAQIDTMWSICKESPGYWNTALFALATAERMEGDPCSLSLSIDIPALEEEVAEAGHRFAHPYGILNRLQDAGIIQFLFVEEDHLSFAYCNLQLKRALSKAGTILELKAHSVARSLTDEKGDPLFQDTLSGVSIDWDGVFHDLGQEQKDTENEIDVILMRGMTPIFISCKNGGFGEGELYKLSTVATRFGGRYAKCVLLSSNLNKNVDSVASLKQRARDMNIQFIGNLRHATDEQWCDIFRSIAQQ